MNNFYRPITDLGIRPDVIDSEASLDKYKVLFTNLVFTLEDRGMGERIREWVENGEYPADMKTLGGLVEDICYNNAAKYFGL